MKKRKLKGVAALITVISLGSLVFIISLSTAVLTYWSIQNVNANQKSLSAYYSAYSGIQDALIRLERNKDFLGSYHLSIYKDNDVEISFNKQGNEITITAIATIDQFIKKITAICDLDPITGLVVPKSIKEG